MLEPRDEGIILWTLRYGDEVRPEEEYFSGIKAQPEGGLAPLMKQLIQKQTKEWSPISDLIQDRYVELIAAKKKTMKKPAKAANKKSSGGDNVIDIKAALKKSLEENKQRSR